MKLKGQDPKDICLKLLKRSNCSVQVAACLVDNRSGYGIYATGWNHMGKDGYGEHAEIMCFKRANPKRVKNSILYVASQRKRNKKPVKSKPCAACWPCARMCSYIIYRDSNGEWVTMRGDL